MMDTAGIRREIDAGFAAAQRAWRLHLCCHTFGQAFNDAQGATVIPPQWHNHRSAACMRIKQHANQACMAYDLHALPSALGAGTVATWKTCHAGLSELIQPVRIADRLEALLYLRPIGPLNPTRGSDLLAAAGILGGWLQQIEARLRAGRTIGSDSRLTRIHTFLEGHLPDDPDLGQLADHLGLSSERTRHLVQELTGHAFRSLKDQHRLMAAQRLLQLGFRPVRDIARACGCADPGWFGRWFRRRTGMTPLAWRREHRPV